MFYAALFRTDLDLLDWGFDFLFNIFLSPLYILAII